MATLYLGNFIPQQIYNVATKNCSNFLLWKLNIVEIYIMATMYLAAIYFVEYCRNIYFGNYILCQIYSVECIYCGNLMLWQQ